MRKITDRIILAVVSAVSICGMVSCNKFLNVVPDDGLATIETAFNLRSTAIRYLGTCYSYMTSEGAPGPYINGGIQYSYGDMAMLTGDELWDLVGRVVSNTYVRVPQTLFNIARGFQSANNVYGYDWAYTYEGIRCCDILMENVVNVPDMEESEKRQWIAEAKFLKAYYHFHLVRKWGPVPIIRKSLPMDSDVETVRVYREPIDTCFDFIIGLLDEAMPDLPLINPNLDELGRATRAICAGLKARVAVYAASPLFNGNEEEEQLVDNRGIRLFPAKTDAEKQKRWDDAVVACQEALDICREANYKMFTQDVIKSNFRMNDILSRDLALRCAFNERWNSEVVWGNTQTPKTSMTMFQQLCMPNMTSYTHSLGGYKFIGVPLKIAEQFYTKNGLPIANDIEWTGVNPYDLKVGDEDHEYYIEPGYTTIKLNFDREPRFYSSLGFDGGKWLGMLTNYNDLTAGDIKFIDCRIGGSLAKTSSETGPLTGYFPKKLFPFRCIMANNSSFTTYWFPWPMIRMSDLYLLYAEAVNEAEGPAGEHSEKMFAMVDSVRTRAGIPSVKESWDKYSNRPGYYGNKVGMRDIIHRERLNELAFESQRFWDIRRWKEAPVEYQKGIYGFHVAASAPEDYYEKTLIAEQPFGLKDYFWPLRTYDIEVNPNLVQNIGW